MKTRLKIMFIARCKMCGAIHSGEMESLEKAFGSRTVHDCYDGTKGVLELIGFKEEVEVDPPIPNPW